MDLFHSERSKLSTVLALLLLLRQGTVSGQDRKPSRTSQYDTSNLNCQIGTKRPKNADLSYQDFEYWYAMGTTGDIDSMKMFNLEQLLYNNVEDDMVWCWEEANDTNKSATKPTQGVRRDRKQRLVAEKKILGMVDSRNLNIITFTPGSMDKETSHRCPDAVIYLVNSTGAAECKVVLGSMRIIAHVNEDVHYAIAALRDGLEAAMANGLGQNGEIANLKFLSYIGDDEDEVLALITGGRPGDVIGQEGADNAGNNSANGDESNGGDVVTGDGSENASRDGGIASEQKASNSDDKKDRVIILFAVGIPLLIALLLAMFLRKNKRTIVTATPYYDMAYPYYILPGTGDPPGHFHEGLFHYFPDGQQYLSTNCEQCFETRRDMKYIDEIHGVDSQQSYERDLATILENEPYDKSLSLEEEDDDDTLPQADPRKGLAQRHMGIDVHSCSSSTCKVCLLGLSKRPVFLSRKAPKGEHVGFCKPVLSNECGEV